MNRLRFSFIVFLANLVCLGSVSCVPRSTPPAPDMAAGVYVDAGFEYFHWEQGLAILIWHDAIQSSSCDSSGSTQDPTHVVRCQATSGENSFNWQIKTQDGVEGDFQIDNIPYDLSNGRVFIVATADGVTDIQQLQRDLSAVTTESESIVDFGLKDPAISLFIEAASAD